jgi:hypothetical protein
VLATSLWPEREQAVARLREQGTEWSATESAHLSELPFAYRGCQALPCRHRPLSELVVVRAAVHSSVVHSQAGVDLACEAGLDTAMDHCQIGAADLAGCELAGEVFGLCCGFGEDEGAAGSL